MFIPRISGGWLAAGVGWLCAVGVGFLLLQEFAVTPGEVPAVPSRWPEASALQPEQAGYRLLLFLHPRCPCSRATLAELAQVLARCPSRATTQVLFYRPSTGEEPWRETDLWETAAALPNIRVSWDEDGREARRFGVKTSGHLLAYDAAGKLRFNGGITRSRGQAGENVGRRTVLDVLNGIQERAEPTAVFGCPLFDARLCLQGDSGPCPR